MVFGQRLYTSSSHIVVLIFQKKRGYLVILWVKLSKCFFFKNGLFFLDDAMSLFVMSCEMPTLGQVGNQPMWLD
jgi:hypothetical protein